MRSTTTSSRILRLAAPASALALILSGCQTGLVDDDTPTAVAPPPTTPGPAQQTQEPEPTDDAAAQTQDAADQTEDADGDDVEDADPTDEAATGTGTGTGTDDSDGDADGDADSGERRTPLPLGQIPEPGAEFEVGDTITTHVQTYGKPSDEYFGYATLATTVTRVEQGDRSLFDEAENGGDFAGYTPWYVYVENEWLTYEGTPNGNMLPNVIAFNEQGGEVSPVLSSTWSAGIPGCELDIPATRGVGERASQCRVFAVPDGQAVGAVGWTGDGYADGDELGANNPYTSNPVLWRVP